MSTTVLNVTEIARNFSEYISRVAYRRERFVLRKGRRVMAELRPVREGRKLGELGALMAALPRLGARADAGDA